MYQDRNKIFEIFRGEPIRLRWGGWVSDSYVLEREGWTFHADEQHNQEMDSHAIRLAVTSPDKYMTISGVTYLHNVDIRTATGYSIWHDQYQRWTERGFEMHQYNAKDVFRTIGHEELRSWKSMNQINIDDLFNRILQIQYPQQQEIKKGLIMPEKKPIIQAKIFSLVA
jgi:hypothetical protein